MTLVDVTSDSFAVLWKINITSDSLLTQHYIFVVKIYPVNGNFSVDSRTVNLTLNENELSVTFNRLSYNTIYNVTVTPYRIDRGKNESGVLGTAVVQTACLSWYFALCWVVIDRSVFYFVYCYSMEFCILDDCNNCCRSIVTGFSASYEDSQPEL